MNWIRDFYHKQAKWSGAYWGDVLDIHRKKALLINEFAGNDHKRVLELGAGGGQHAVAIAELGYEVIAVEIVPDLAQHMRELVERHPGVNVTIVEGDFYQIEFPYQFDVVCYWDGFGIGTDNEQRRLLKQIQKWLKEDGYALIDVYTPWHAAKSSGYGERIGEALRRYEFDADQCRWLDYWWMEGKEDQKIAQSLRCYSPEDFRLLLDGTGLELAHVRAGGMMNYEKGQFIRQAPLHKAMWFLAVLTQAYESYD